MGLWKIIFLLVLLNFFLVGGYLIYDRFPGELKELTIQNLGSGESDALVNISGNVVQFYPNMRFNHDDLTYSLHPDCSLDKENRVREALFIIKSEVPVLSFREIVSEKADILVACSPEAYEKEENLFIAGEGGPTNIVNATIPIILKGKLTLYNDTGKVCDYPVTELHELFHVFGFDHINDTKSILYPFIECDQRITSDLGNALRELYQIEALPELYFKNVTASKSGRYLSFNVTISNDGLIDSLNTLLEVYVEGKFVQGFALNDVSFGGGQKFYVNNLRLPSRGVNEIELRLRSDNGDSNLNNNIVELVLIE